MEYFYTPPDLVTPPVLTIEGDEFRHLSHVMRMRAGDALRVVDGAGTAFDAVITEVGRRAAVCTITASRARLHEPARAVTLAVGILKNPSRFDFLVEKGVELGVRAIVPLLTERTIARHGNIGRWQKLCIAAMKQSGRCVLPSVEPLTSFGDFIALPPRGAARFLPHEKATSPLIPPPAGSGQEVVMCIGPEGGFSDREVQEAQEAGFTAVSLGPRRLRTETAAVAAVAAVLRDEDLPESFLP